MRVLADGGHWSWPVVLREGDVELRPLRRSDARAWRSVRAANVAWLTPWEATHPDADASPRHPRSGRWSVASPGRPERGGCCRSP